jgi:hypothetical protein
VVYNFQTGINKINSFTEGEHVIQNVLFGNAVLSTLVSWRKYDVIPQNGDCSRENSMRRYFEFFETKSAIKMQRRYRTQYGKDPRSDNAI